jgi:flagellar hook-associated protein 1 FlgK
MSLASIITLANGALTNVTDSLDIVSHNVANAGTAGYADETLTQQSAASQGMDMGVRTGIAVSDVNQQLQTDLLGQNSIVTGLQTTLTNLNTINDALGTVGQGGDLSSLLTSLQNGFTTLAQNPDDASQQQQVVTDAQQLAQGINTLSAAYTSARQSAQDDLVSAVGSLNQALNTIGTLNQQIIQATNQGLSTADLTSQLANIENTVSNLVGAKFLPQTNGGVLVVTTSGLILPTDPTSDAATTSDTTINPQSSEADGTIPAITVGGVDVTPYLTGGQIGADLTMRDTTIPTYQAELDEFSQTLATRFANQGLTLFSNPDGTLPVSNGFTVQNGYVGFSSTITVNPSVVADPSQVRDGNTTVAVGAVGAAGFVPNDTSTGGPAGYTGLITNVLDYTFGDSSSSGVPYTAIPSSGLGQDGTLSAPFVPPVTLSDYVSTMITSQASDTATAKTQLATQQTLQTTLQTSLNNQSGVNLDTELSNMVQLQNAYGANARILAAAQAMWTDLLTNVAPAAQ